MKKYHIKPFSKVWAWFWYTVRNW